MPAKNEAFLALEQSLQTRVENSIRKAQGPLVRRIASAAAKGDWGRANDLITAIDLEPAVRKQEKFIRLVSVQAMLFGARDFARAKNTAIAKQGPGEELENAVESYVAFFSGPANAEVKQLASDLVEEERAAQEGGVAKSEHVFTTVQKQATAGFVKQFNKRVGDTASAYAGLGSSLHTSRLASWGFTVEADLRGFATYEVDAVLDGRTCPVCRQMDGKTFEVGPAKRKLEGWLREKDPQQLKAIARFPRQDKQSLKELSKMSDSELVEKGWDTPPYHPWCRCVLRRTETRVVPAQPITDIIPDPRAVAVARDATIRQSDFDGIPNNSLRKRQGAAFSQGWDQEDFDWYNENIRVPPKDIHSAWGGTLMKADDISRTQWSRDGDKLIYRSSSKDGTTGIKRMIQRTDEGLVVQHDMFVLSPELQGKGAAKRVLRNSFDLYEQMGVKRVQLYANIDVGGYAWAKYGALPNDPADWESLREDVLRRLNNSRDLYDAPTLQELDRILGSDDPRELWNLSDMSIKGGNDISAGKHLLLNQNWPGVFDLTDEETMTRFRRYVG